MRCIHHSSVQGAGLTVTELVVGPPMGGIPRKVRRPVSGALVVVCGAVVVVVVALKKAVGAIDGSAVVSGASSSWTVVVRAAMPRAC